MRKKVIAIVSLWLAGAVFIGSGGACRLFSGGGHDMIPTVQAGKVTSKDIQKQIDEANRRRQAAEEEKEKLESDIERLEKKKENVLDYIEALDDKLSELSEKIAENEGNIAKVNGQIEVLREEKKEAVEDKKRQYDTMSRRIKYMYENGNEGYFELLLGAGSLSELFNRMEYVNKVTSYDNQMLDKYKEICDKIQKAQESLEIKLGDLKVLKESLKVERDSVDALMDKKTAKLKSYQSIIDDKNDAVHSQQELIKRQEAELEKLLEAQRRQIAKEQEEAAKKAAQEGEPSGAGPGKGFRWPLAVSGRISSYFGYRTAPTAGASTYHKGIDVAVPVGTRVLAAQSGMVVTAAYSSSAGNYVAICHGGGIYTYYMHCSKISVSVGAKVSKGQQVALSGNSGVSTGPHLHFAVYANGSYVNPMLYVSQG